jgi:tetratricopeptide (TPR) repeat protein
VDNIRFIFWEGLKVLTLVLLGFLAAKSVASLDPSEQGMAPKRFSIVKSGLYCLILILVVLGAICAGNDVAAEVYHWTSQANLDHSQPARAYDNAVRAVRVRPGNLRYWRQVVLAKIGLHQFESALDDRPAFESLTKGSLDEEDAYRFILCDFHLGRYESVVRAAQKLIDLNPRYAAPYILQGLSDTALGKYDQAEKAFLAVLQIYPNHQAAVEGLAHTYFLWGKRSAATDVLTETAKYAFPPEARKRFEDLKAIYAQ